MNEKESAQEIGLSAGKPTSNPGVGGGWWLLSIASTSLPWVSQPPLAWWPVALVAVIPLLLAAVTQQISRRQYAVLYLAAFFYWALTLQGLRHANPLIYPCWVALAAYLAIYPIAFVVVLRRLLRYGILLIVAAPTAWVAMECIRNYLLTGISAAMLGHAVADTPLLIQIADLGGTYAVSFALVAANVALLVLGSRLKQTESNPLIQRRATPTIVAVVALWAACLLYGQYRLGQPTKPAVTTIALIGRNEPVEYDQPKSRELELYDAYARESIRAFESTDLQIDAVIWPESMFNGTMPWGIGEGGSSIALANGLSVDEERAMIAEHQRRFQFRASSLQAMLAAHNGPQALHPDILGGCGVIDYGEKMKAYSGIVHIGRTGNVEGWYGKTHLVMFGEYIPVLGKIPVVRNWIPENIGLTHGDGARRFHVGQTTLCPNICIETAVERVTINHLRELRNETDGSLPDVIVTVTNDAWFDDSSVVQHHKRCAQLVAVACRRPILSSANNGPTAWIDSCGRVVKEIPQGENGSVIATPGIDDRISLVMLIGDWPARICAFLFLIVLVKRPKRLAALQKNAAAKS